MKALRALGVCAILVALPSFAQTVVGGSGGAMDPRAQIEADMARDAEMESIRKQYRDAMDETENGLIRAKAAWEQCEMQEKMSNMQADQAQQQAKGQAIGNAVQQAAPMLGNLAKEAFGGAKKETASAKDRMADFADEIKNDYGGTVSNGRATCRTEGMQQKCLQTYPVQGSPDTNASLRMQCVQNMTKDCRTAKREYENAVKDVAGGSHLGGAAMEAALGAAVGAMGATMGMRNAKEQAQFAKEGNGMNRDMCEQTQQMEIDGLNKKMARLKEDMDKAMLNASMVRALPQLSAGQGPTTNVPVVSGDGGFIPDMGGSITAANLPQGKSPAAVNQGGGGGGGGGAPGGGGGGGGGADGGDAGWSFGSGQGGGGLGSPLPPQPDAESYANTEGGGFFGGGEGSGEGAVPGDEAFFAGDGYGGGAGGPSGIGDGGLNVMLSRLRQRLIAHGPELVRSMDLQKMASSRSAAPKEERVPQSLRSVE